MNFADMQCKYYKRVVEVLVVSMEVDVFAEQRYGKVALKKMAPCRKTFVFMRRVGLARSQKTGP